MTTFSKASIGATRAGGRRTSGGRPRAIALGLSLLLALVGITGVVPSPAAAAPAEGLATWETAVLNLPNGGVAYDATRDVVLVAVAPSVPTLGNHLVEVDPHTGTLGRAVTVGPDPRTIAIADDGSRAYVGGLGSSTVTEVDLASFTVSRTISLGNDRYDGPYYAEDIEVQPGHPSVIAVSRRNQGLSPRHEGVAIFDAGVQRPTVTAGHTGANRITWSDDPATLYGYNNESTGYGFFVLTVGPTGVTLTTPGSRFTGFYLDIEHADGEVVATSGQVVDTATLALSGAYTASGPVEVDVAQGSAFFLNGTTLTRHDVATKLQTGSRTVPSISPSSLIDAGSVLVAAGSGAVMLLGPGVSAAGFALPPPPETRVQTWAARSTAVAVEEVVGATDGSRVYGVVRQDAALHPGSLVEIDAASGQVTRTLLVGADPNRIGLSADGSTLLVGHDDANRLTEVAVATLSIRRTIALPAGEWANDIAPRPGTSSTFAVVLVNHCCSPALEGSILVQDGVVLPGRGPDHTGATSITFASDPNRLYGHNGGSTDFGFYTLAVEATGLRPLSSTGSLLEGFGLEVVSAGGRVYASNGGVVDPTVPTRLGSVASGGQPVPVPAAGRLLMVSGSSIKEFDIASFGAVASHSFSGGSVRDAVLAGSRLVIATTSGQVVFIPVGEDTRQPPTVTGFVPSVAPTRGGGSITVRGTSFTYATTVRIGGASTPFTVVDDTTITATIPAHAGGTVPVTVTNPRGTSSGGPLLTYRASRPVVTALSPPGGPTAGGNPVTITGTGFSFATSVAFGTTPATSFTVMSDRKINAVAPAHTAGTVDVVVTTSGGSNAPDPAGRYAFNPAPPSVASVTPNSGLRLGGQAVEIAGGGFYGATRVEFGSGHPATFEVLSDSRIRAVTPAHPSGTVSVRVTTANGTSAATPWVTWYSFRERPPAVTSVSPASGPRSGGNLVAVYGSDLTGATAVRFGTTPATGFVVLDDGAILATAPPGPAGPTTITVTTPHGSSGPAAAAYTYGDAPVVTGLSSSSGPASGGRVVTITGSGFTGTTTIEFGEGLTAPIFEVVSDTRIDVLTPPRPAGTVDVFVSATFGTSTASAPSTTYEYADVVAGKVTDEGSGQPLEGVEVWVSSGGSIVGTTTTDADGEYEVVVPAGPGYQVRFLSTTTHLGEANGDAMGLATAPELVVPGVILQVDAALLAKAEAGAISGEVTDGTTGAPVPGVYVAVFADGVRARTLRTDELGEFTATGLDPDRDWHVRYEGAAHQAQYWPASPTLPTATALPVVAGGTADASAALTRTTDLASVTGVVTAAGTPLAGTRVQLMFSADPSQPAVSVASATTDAGGRYSFPAVLPGTYRVRFARDGYRTEFWINASTLATATPLSLGLGARPTCDAVLEPRPAS